MDEQHGATVVLVNERALARRHWGVLLAVGIVAVIFGIVVIVWPGLTIAILMILVGIDAILFGAAMIAQGLALRKA